METENGFLDARDGPDGTSWSGTEEEWKQKYGMLFQSICTAPLRQVPNESVAETRARAKQRKELILFRKRVAYQGTVPIIAAQRPKGNHTEKLDRNQLKFYPAWNFAELPVSIEETEEALGKKRKRNEVVTEQELADVEELKKQIIVAKTKYDDDAYFEKQTRLQELYEFARFPGNANDFYSVWPKKYWPMGQGIFISSQKRGEESKEAYEIRRQLDIERLIALKKQVLEKMAADGLEQVSGDNGYWKNDPVRWQCDQCKKVKEQLRNEMVAK